MVPPYEIKKNQKPKQMITIRTYQLEPAAKARTNEFTTEWLREEVNKLMLPKRGLLEKQGVDTSLFYNHDPLTSRTRQGYPLVIYHCLDGLFYITGINEGALAIEKLAGHYSSLQAVDDSFRDEKTNGKFGLSITDQSFTYSLIEWRPIHHKQRAAFATLSMMAKVTELQHKLEKHLTNELGKYLNISLDGLKLEITDITRIYEPATYKNHKYPAFDIRFKANVSLPAMITLGNNKALGYGRVVPE
jgi:hypothetical protein